MGLKLADADTTITPTRKVGMYKLANGLDVLGEIQAETSTEIRLKNPMILVVARNNSGQNAGSYGIQFIPFAIGAAEDAPARIFRSHVVSELIPESNLESAYFGLFSNLITPPTNKKILGPGELRLTS